jgi:hypothetical protein
MQGLPGARIQLDRAVTEAMREVRLSAPKDDADKLRDARSAGSGLAFVQISNQALIFALKYAQ